MGNVLDAMKFTYWNFCDSNYAQARFVHSFGLHFVLLFFSISIVKINL